MTEQESRSGHKRECPAASRLRRMKLGEANCKSWGHELMIMSFRLFRSRKARVLIQHFLDPHSLDRRDEPDTKVAWSVG